MLFIKTSRECNAPGSSEITGGGAADQIAYFSAASNITGSALFTHATGATTGTTRIGNLDTWSVLAIRPSSSNGSYYGGELRLYYEDSSAGGSYAKLGINGFEGLNSISIKRKGSSHVIGGDYDRWKIDAIRNTGSGWSWNPGVMFNYIQSDVATFWRNADISKGIVMTSGSISGSGQFPKYDISGGAMFIDMASGSERIVMGNNVGIGTASPSQKLQIFQSRHSSFVLWFCRSKLN